MPERLIALGLSLELIHPSQQSILWAKVRAFGGFLMVGQGGHHSIEPSCGVLGH